MNELLHVSKTPGPVGSKCPHAGQNRVRGILRGGESLRYPYRPVMPVDEDEIGKSPSYVTSDHQHRSPGLSEQRQPQVMAPLHVLSCQPLGRFSVAPLDRHDDLLVLGCPALRPAREGERVVIGPPNPGMHLRDETLEHRVAGDVANRLVERHIALCDRGDVAGGRRILHLAVQPAQFCHVHRSSLLRSQSRGRSVERYPEHIEFGDLLRIHIADNESAVRRAAYELLGFQPAQRLANRRPTYAELHGERFLVQPVTRLKRSGDDSCAQRFVRRVPGLQGARTDPPNRHEGFQVRILVCIHCISSIILYVSIVYSVYDSNYPDTKYKIKSGGRYAAREICL